MKTKGFNFKIKSSENGALVITNTMSTGNITFITTEETEKDYFDLTDIKATWSINLPEESFVKLVDKLVIEADKIKNKMKDKDKVSVDFGEDNKKDDKNKSQTSK